MNTKRKKVRMGMIGGGKDAFIGAVHRMAASLDGQIDLVCGAFSSDPHKSKEMGRKLFLDESRVYNSFEEMINLESKLPENERMEFAALVTPNHLHFAPSKLALQKGFHVLCEKPLCFSMQEARELEKIVKASGKLFGLTHNYTGYPMVKEARELVRSGKLGKIRKVMAEYPQGWLSSALENSGQKQASWRTDSEKAGISCCVGDIGTHAANLAEYITGLMITEIAADISTFVEGRTLDDDANILLRLEKGAKGILSASQVATGEENELKIRIYGEKGGIEWLQSEPNSLIVKYAEQPKQVFRAGTNNSYLSEITRKNCRLPGGHPEGYIESLANIYSNFAEAITGNNENHDFPDISDGVRGMRFIEATIESGKSNSKWIKL
jgi:predicted dehydrogenase